MRRRLMRRLMSGVMKRVGGKMVREKVHPRYVQT